MNNLNDLGLISELDKAHMAKIIADLPNQLASGWEESQKLIIPSYYLKVNKVVIVGMGGSGIAGAITQSLLKNEADLPIIIHRDYGIPAFVDDKTLVIAVSYSGETEEVLDSFVAAYQRGAKLVAICTGGKLESLAKKYKAPYYRYTYISLPRAAIGFMVGSILGILKKIGIAGDIVQKEIDETIILLNKINENLKPEDNSRKNYAKRIANAVYDNSVEIWAADMISGVARRWKCQINENAENLATMDILPELNHNTIASLDFPKTKNIYILILKSKFYSERIQKRIEITRDILNKKEIPNMIVQMDIQTNNSIAETMAYILLGDYVSFYLSILNNVDPSINETIDSFKEKLI